MVSCFLETKIIFFPQDSTWNVRANLRVIIKRALRKYGYPPDMQQLATETVMKQAELLAEELVGAIDVIQSEKCYK